MDVDVSVIIDAASPSKAGVKPSTPGAAASVPAATSAAAAAAAAPIHDPHHDCVRPIFHVLPAAGWASDPSGPVYYKGRYHMFFQHLRTSCQWYWGLAWDHVVSSDLVHWTKLPPALVPTPAWYDADGCFSGTVELDPETGVPVIVYTGVYLKTNSSAVKALGLPPPEYDMPTRFVETQLAAMPADPDDPDLTQWVKLPEPVARYPPPRNPFSCWRDPACLVRGDPGAGREWVWLLASGVVGQGGAVLVYKSKHLMRGWRYVGLLAAQGDMSLGQDWECPILTQLPELTQDAPAAAAAAALLPGHLSLPGEVLAAPWSAVGPAVAAAAPHSIAAAAATTAASHATAAAPVAPHITAEPPPPAARHELPGGWESATPLAPPVNVPPAVERWLATPHSAEDPPSSAAEGPAAAQLAEEMGRLEVQTVAEEVPQLLVAGGLMEPGGPDVSPMRDQVPRRLTRQQQQERVLEAAGRGPPAAVREALVALAAGTRGKDSVTSTSSTLSTADHSPPSYASSNSSNRSGSGSLPVSGSAPDVAGMVAKGELEPAVVPPPLTEAGLHQEDASLWVGAADAAQLLTELSQPAGCMGLGGPHHQGKEDTLLPSSGPLALADVAPAAAGAAQMDEGESQLGGGGSSSLRPGPWFFCISPDACNYPIRYWLGEADLEGRDSGGCPRFDLTRAAGPFKLDLGRTLYAASCWPDPQGRQLLWGWIQEHRRVPPPPCECDAFSYAGCLSVPRVLLATKGRLHQAPLPELALLRSRVSWHTSGVTLVPGGPPLPLQRVSGTHLDLEASFLPPDDGVAGRVGFVLRSWRPGGVGAAVVSFDWSTRELVVDFDQTLPHAYDPYPEETPHNKRVGGTLDNMEPGEPLSLRLLLDGSVLEVFTGSGETLTTRVYRGAPPPSATTSAAVSAAAAAVLQGAGGVAPQQGLAAALAAAGAVQRQAPAAEAGGADAGIDVFAAGGGPVVLSRLDVWEMCSGWVGGSSPGSPGGVPPSSQPYTHNAVVAPAFLAEVLAAQGAEGVEGEPCGAAPEGGQCRVG